MISKQRTFAGIALISLVALAGCNAALPGQDPAATAAPVAAPTVASAPRTSGDIIAEGTLEPAHWNEIAYSVAGTVEEVLVAEGDMVEEGQILARLDSVYQKAALAQAEAGLSRAKAHLAELQAGPRTQEIEVAQTAIEGAKAQLERIQQGPRPEEIAPATAALGIAQASLQKVQEGASEDLLIAARADLANADAAVAQAQAAYDRVALQANVGELPQSLQLQQATNARQAAQARLDELSRGATAADIAIARRQVEQAQAQIDLLNAPTRSSDITAAQAEINRAVAQLNLLEAGARPETIAAAEADVASAQAALDQATRGLADRELRAPFAGTATDVRLKVGDQLAPGVPVVTLADLSRFFVRTDDLTELDIARVAVDQQVAVTLDALPGREFSGTVREISLEAGDHLGDVVYDVLIELSGDDGLDGLRWGMTAVANIDTN